MYEYLVLAKHVWYCLLITHDTIVNLLKTVVSTQSSVWSRDHQYTGWKQSAVVTEKKEN